MARNYFPIAVAVAIIVLTFLLVIIFGPFKATGHATQQDVTIGATIASTITCTASPTSLSFGTLTLGSDATTTSGTVIDTTGSTDTAIITATVQDATTWIPGFTSVSTSWAILCPNNSVTPSGLTDPTGFRRHEFTPSINKCGTPDVSGALLGLGNPTLRIQPPPSQTSVTHHVFSKIHVPAGTAAGTYQATERFTCALRTGAETSLAFEVVDVESPTLDATVAMGNTNKYVGEATLGPNRAQIDSSQAPVIYVCDSVGKCLQGASVTPALTNCLNSKGPITGTTHTNPDEIGCGTFVLGTGLTAGSGELIMEIGPLVSPAGAYVFSHKDITIGSV
jgi:hypothetical protein